jgi:formylmethanofuran dehydrogenase subunit E
MSALNQDQHEAINAREYPGTRQICALCGEPTGRCEEDSLYRYDEEKPVCEACYESGAE